MHDWPWSCGHDEFGESQVMIDLDSECVLLGMRWLDLSHNQYLGTGRWRADVLQAPA